MFFWDVLASQGDQVALIDSDGPVTYAELSAKADQVATEVAARLPDAVGRPLVLLEAASDLASVAAYLGVLRAGWPVILTAPGAADNRIAVTYRPNVILRQSDVGLQIDLGSSEPHALHPELAVLLSTSGTTGAAKLVRLSRANLQANAEAIASYLDLRATDRTITTLPLHYSYGMSVLHIHLLAGAAVVLSAQSLVDDGFWPLARQHGVASLALVPTQFELLDRMGFQESWLPSLRYMTQAGGRLDPLLAGAFARRARERGWNLFIMYGQTEASPRISYVPPGDAEAWHHTIGRPIPGGELSLVDAAGQPIEVTGVVGELVYHGPNVMQGYALGPLDLAAPAGPPELRTGDLAERLENGFFRITGRASRFLKLFGLRIGLDEVESTLRAEGRKVYATGSDQRLVVFWHEPGDVLGLRAAIAMRFKLPESAVAVAPLDEVPLLASGKVDYRALAGLAEALGVNATKSDTAGPDAREPNVASGSSDLLAILRQVLRRSNFDLDRTFLQMGGDSLSYLEVTLYLAKRHPDGVKGWERMSLRDLLALDAGAIRLTTPANSPEQDDRSPQETASKLALPADIICRLAAVSGVVALHSTSWKTGGGAYLLLILVGFSLARFQSASLFEGAVGRTLQVMLLPILTCYYIIIALVGALWEPIGPAWFLLLGNFVTHPSFDGLVPYWFVSTYTQVVALAALPFLLRPVRQAVRQAPFYSGLIALACLALVVEVVRIDEIQSSLRHHNPLGALELVAIGWCLCFMASARDRLMLLGAIGLVWTLHWSDLNATSWAFVLLGSAAMLWDVEVVVPSPFARLAMQVGGLTMFIYLLHAPVIAVVVRVIEGPEAVRFALVIVATLLLAAGAKKVYDGAVTLVQSPSDLLRTVRSNLGRGSTNSR